MLDTAESQNIGILNRIPIDIAVKPPTPTVAPFTATAKDEATNNTEQNASYI